jgi:2-polyprenyl-6-methoxyphenol hydroxylase-like FAD-dependent oxidoreductase
VSETAVLIVGAGPTGLVLGIELARRGIPFRLIDRNPQPLGWDRATVIKPRSLELFDAFGLAETFMQRGCIVRQATFFLKGEKVASVSFGDLDSRFKCMLSLPESETERILTEKLEELGGAVERDLELTGLKRTVSNVRAQLRRVSTGAESEQEAMWLVGTDGIHSAVRDAVADPFEGRDNPLLWAVVDGHLRGWMHPPDAIGVQLERPAVNPIPLGDGRWRVYFRPDDARADDALDRVAEGLSIMSPGASLSEHDTPRFFHTHSRVARSYRVDRVLLAGDAAHACSPIQGHGMNVGMQDAYNLGWKLALVVQGEASADLLNSYEAERRPIAQTIVASGVEAEKRFGGKDSDIAEAVKRISNVEGHHRAVLAESEIAHCYRDSPIVLDVGPEVRDGDEATQVGCRISDVEELAYRDGVIRLHELLRSPKHTLLVMSGGHGQDAAECLDRAALLAERFRSHVEAFAVVRTVPDGAALRKELIHDQTGDLHRRLAADRPCLCLIRPDGHLAFRSTDLSLERPATYLRGIFARIEG